MMLWATALSAACTLGGLLLSYELADARRRLGAARTARGAPRGGALCGLERRSAPARAAGVTAGAAFPTFAAVSRHPIRSLWRAVACAALLAFASLPHGHLRGHEDVAAARALAQAGPTRPCPGAARSDERGAAPRVPDLPLPGAGPRRPRPGHGSPACRDRRGGALRAAAHPAATRGARLGAHRSPRASPRLTTAPSAEPARPARPSSTTRAPGAAACRARSGGDHEGLLREAPPVRADTRRLAAPRRGARRRHVRRARRHEGAARGPRRPEPEAEPHRRAAPPGGGRGARRGERGAPRGERARRLGRTALCRLRRPRRRPDRPDPGRRRASPAARPLAGHALGVRLLDQRERRAAAAPGGRARPAPAGLQPAPGRALLLRGGRSLLHRRGPHRLLPRQRERVAVRGGGGLRPDPPAALRSRGAGLPARARHLPHRVRAYEPAPSAPVGLAGPADRADALLRRGRDPRAGGAPRLAAARSPGTPRSTSARRTPTARP